MFRRVALRLTVFNALVILAILALAGAATYLSTRYILIRDLDSSLERAAAAARASHAFEEAYGRSAASGRSSNREREEDHDDETGVPASHPALLLDARGDVLAVVAAPGSPASEDEVWRAGPFDEGVAAALAGRRDVRSGRADDKPYRFLTVPVTRNGAVIGAVQVPGSEESLRALLGTLLLTLAAVGAGGLLLAVAGGWLLTTRALAPLREAFTRQRAFIAEASHELRTPVAVIQADAEALRRLVPNLKPEDAQLLEDLAHESASLSALVGQLLAIARLESGRETVSREPLDLAALTCDVARGMEAVARTAGVTVSVAPSPCLIPVQGDPVRLRAAIANIVDNAVKYNRPGGAVAVSARRDGRWAEVTVKDTGRGIAEKDLPRVFERFYRGESARAGETPGAGLGLALARLTARLHGGDVTLASAEGQGTTATLRVPAG